MNDSASTPIFPNPTRADLARRLKAYAELQARIRRQSEQLRALHHLAQQQATALVAAAQQLQPAPGIALPEASLERHAAVQWHGLTQTALAELAAAAPQAVQLRYHAQRRALAALWATPGGQATLRAQGIRRQTEVQYRIRLHLPGGPTPLPSLVPPVPPRARRPQVARNRALLARFRALHSQQDLGMEATLRQLAREFYLSERTVQRVLRGAYKVV